MMSISTFPTFDEARALAEQEARAGGHRVQWMAWGSPPRCGHAPCERCGHSLRIVRTREALYRLEGSALSPCRPTSVVPLAMQAVQ